MVPWNPEGQAAELVAGLLGGTATARDPGGGPVQLHDIDIHVGDRCYALEVTRHNLPSAVQRDNAVARREWQFGELTMQWGADVAVARISALHGRIGPLLEELERAEVRRFGKFDRGDVHPAAAELLRLGVTHAYVFNDSPIEGLDNPVVTPHAGAGSTSPDIITNVVNDHASRRDNVAKLTAADADEGHLFVWVEASRGEAIAAMSFGVLPSTFPDLSEAIQTAWVATAFNPTTVWRFDRGTGWQDAGSWSWDDCGWHRSSRRTSAPV